MQVETIPWKIEDVPGEKIIPIDGTNIKFRIDYNEVSDSFTLTVLNTDDAILYTAPLLYGTNALHARPIGWNTTRRIVPLNLSELSSAYALESRVDADNLLRSVELVLL